MRAKVPKVTIKLGAQVCQCCRPGSLNRFWISRLAWSPIPVAAVRTAGRSLALGQIIIAAIAFWRAVKGGRAVFGSHSTPRMGVFRDGIMRGRCREASEPHVLGPRPASFACARPSVIRSSRPTVLGPPLSGSAGPVLSAFVFTAGRCAAGAPFRTGAVEVERGFA